MSAGQDFVALDWIKADISETLDKAQHALEAVAENGDDPSSMRACLTALHQVHGTLKMVEIEGPVMVAGEMEALAQALMNNQVPDVGHAQELLMQTILQMPGYLDRIQREQQDNPQFVKPTVNNLRISRGAEKLDGDDVPERSVFIQAPTDSVIEGYAGNDGPATIKKIRARYQQSLSALLKKQSPRENLGTIAKVLQMQAKLCRKSPVGYFAEALLAIVEGVVTGSLKLDGALAGLLRNYDALLKVLAEGTPDSLGMLIPPEFVDQVEKTLGKAEKETPRIEAAKAFFVSSDGAGVSLTEDVDFGPDDETVAAVSRILIEEMNGVTDKLDLYVRSSTRQTSDLVALVQPMEQISSTLLVVGKQDHQQSILAQIGVIRSMETSGAEPSDDQLLDIAGALLQVSADLNRLVGDIDDDGESDHFGDLDEAQATVIRETRNGLARSKDAVIEYISNDFAKDRLETLADNLRSLGSGLSIVNQQRCADVLAACSRYVDEKLLATDTRPTLSDLDDLADAITSIDYFLERFLESTTDPYWQMVEVAEAAIGKLGYSVTEDLSQTVVTDSIEPIVEAPTNTFDETESNLETSDVSDAVDLPESGRAPVDADLAASETTLPAAETSLAEEIAAEEAADTELEEDDDLIDDEILDIFIEEATEVLETLGEYLPLYSANVENAEALTELRRAFHTLKGSGRMVGATVVGELAWAIEDMLNRVLDNSIEPGPELLGLLDEVVESLPQGVEAFKNSEQASFDTSRWVERAHILAAGGAPVADDLSETETETETETEETAAESQTTESTVDETALDESALDETPLNEISGAELPGQIAEDLSETTFDIEPLDDELETIEDSFESAPLESAETLEPAATFDADVSEPVTSEPETYPSEPLDAEAIDAEPSDQDGSQFVTEEAAEPEFESEAETHESPEVSESTEITLDAVAAVESLDAEEAFELDDLSLDSPEPPPENDLSSDFVAVETDSESVGKDLAAPEVVETDFEEAISGGYPAQENLATPESLDHETESDGAIEILDFEADTVQADEADGGTPDGEFSIADLSDGSEDDATFELDDLSEDAPGGDIELDQIFLEEADDNLKVLESVLSNSSAEIDPNAVAAYHTLKGSASMAEIPSIAVIAAPMESLLGGMLTTLSPITESVRGLMAESINLIREVMADLGSHRLAYGRGDEFALKISASTLASEPTPSFDFKIVRHLSQAEPVIAEWSVDGINELRFELAQVIDQAEELGHEPIVDLCSTLLEVYEQLEEKPDGLTLEVIQSGHEALVLMFDQLASSQQVDLPEQEIAALRDIDFAALGERQALRAYSNQMVESLQHFNTSVAEYSESPDNQTLQRIKDDLSRWLQEREAEEPAAITLELMLQLAEALDGADEKIITLLQTLSDQLIAQFSRLDDSAQEGLSDDLAAEVRNVLAARQSAAMASGVEPDEAPDYPSSEVEAPTEAPAESQTEPELSPGNGSLLPADDIDDDVLPLFIEEAEELVESIDEAVLVWSGETNNPDHLDLLLRHLHTLKGGARLAGLNSLGEYTHNFETFLIGVQQSPVQLDDGFFALLNDRQDEITRRVEIYSKLIRGQASAAEMASMRREPVPSSAAARKTSTTDSSFDESAATAESSGDELTQIVPIETQALPEDDIDADVLPIFVEEAEELVEAIDQCILDWSNDPTAKEFHDDLLRHLHTLKGGARLAGINSLGEFAHNFETYLIGIQQNPVPFNDAFFAALNQQQDEITRRVEVYRKLGQGEVSEAEMASLSEAPAVVVPEGVEIPDDLPPPASPTITDNKSAASAGNQEMVRVSADLLEDLISLAGESNITRGRVEQQIRDFGESIQEMEETINRVREQVRRLEIEAESRETVFRLAREENEGDSAFDDLELDRYTMLQEISRTLSESSSDMMDLKDTLTNKSRDAETLLHQQARIGTELQEGLTRTRMVPFARLIPRLRRIVRQVSSEVGKSVRFDAFNVEGELDRSVLERIVAPLEHMLRNAVDHGIESVETRRQSNKPETGRISLRLSREGGYVVLTISDDGGGINVDAVRRKAIERGVMSEDSNLTDHDIMQFIMHAGFSTAQKLTQISGRGVGMDVVNSEIKQLGGSISIDSTFGVGSEFTIHIPFTVSINRALLVVVREETYAVPLNTIEGIVRVSPYELEAYYQPDAPVFEYAGQPYRLVYMGKMLERGDDPALEGLTAPLPVILARSGDQSVALQVDRVIGSREIVSKSLGRQFSDVAGVSGATVMGDGSVIVILDVLAFIRKSEAGISQEALEQAAEVEQLHRVRKVMIVDDSVTVRKVTSRLMERQGWEVTTAKDGLDAMNQLQDIYPDIVLLDIEMPKMDGFEVLKSVRRDPRLEKLPIIMITSRTGEKHKQQAFELGVNQYLGKPFQEANLLSTIDEVLATAGDNS